MKHKAVKTATIAALTLAGSLLLPVSAANAATVNDEAGLFSNTAEFKSELVNLEQERGLEITVNTLPDSDTEVDISAEADSLRGENENSIAVVLQEGSNKLGVSYGTRITHIIGKDTLDKIVDKEMIPAFREGEYEEGVKQLLESVNLFMALESGSDTPAAPGINGWFAENKTPFAVAAIAFLLFFSTCVFFLGKRSVRKAEELSESLNNEKQRRLKDVLVFWDSVDEDVQERFVQAANRLEREAVISEVFDQQSFMDDNARLTNVVGSFLYPGKIQENRSIQHFIDMEMNSEALKKETLELWEGLTDDERSSFRHASSESHQEALASKLFPHLNSVEIAARLRVMVPDSRSIDPNYQTYVESRLAEEEAKQVIDVKPKKGLLFSLFGGK